MKQTNSKNLPISWRNKALFLIMLLFPVLASAEAENLAQMIQHNAFNVDRLWVLIAAGMVFLMQAGFLCFEVGIVRKKNATAMGLKNLIDWIILSLAFFGIGFAIMFGHSDNGWFGTDLFYLDGMDSSDASPLGMVFFMFQLAFAGTALTIVSGCMSERTAFIPYLVGSAVMGIVIYSVFGHWAWGNLFIESNKPWLAELGFMDFAGSTVVHSVGAWVGLVGAWVVGPRLGRFGEDGKARPMKSNSIAFSALGVVILWFGWWGFNGGSTLAMDDSVGSIIVNTNIAAAAGGFAAFFHCFFTQDKQNLNEKLLGGILGGLVAITAGCNVVTPMGALGIGLAAGLVHNYAYCFILNVLKIDDPVGAIAVHGFCGVWGTLAVGLMGQQELLALPRLEQIGVQLLGIGVCFVWATSTAWIMYRILKVFVGLRVSPDVESEGIDIATEFEHEVEQIDEDVLAMLQAMGKGNQK